MSGFPDPWALDRQALLRALEGLSHHLAERNIRAHIYVVGGAAMVLAHRAARATRDVDALAIDRRGEVLAAAGKVADEQGLPPNWLNDAVRTAPWPTPLPDARAELVYDSPHLVVTGASAWQLRATRGAVKTPSRGSSFQSGAPVFAGWFPLAAIPRASMYTLASAGVRRERQPDRSAYG